MIFLHTINFYKKHTMTFISTTLVIRSGEYNQAFRFILNKFSL